MKFLCLCGKIISDNSDSVLHKARLIADEDWERFLESAHRPEPVGHDWRLVTDIYQCSDRGCLRIEKPKGQVVFFKPEDDTVPKFMLRSVSVPQDGLLPPWGGQL